MNGFNTARALDERFEMQEVVNLFGAATFVVWLDVFFEMVMRLCYELHGTEFKALPKGGLKIYLIL